MAPHQQVETTRLISKTTNSKEMRLLAVIARSTANVESHRRCSRVPHGRHHFQLVELLLVPIVMVINERIISRYNFDRSICLLAGLRPLFLLYQERVLPANYRKFGQSNRTSWQVSALADAQVPPKVDGARACG